MADQWKKVKEWEDVYLERLEDAGVARITWNKPEKRNSLTRAMMMGGRMMLMRGGETIWYYSCW